MKKVFPIIAVMALIMPQTVWAYCTGNPGNTSSDAPCPDCIIVNGTETEGVNNKDSMSGCKTIKYLNYGVSENGSSLLYSVRTCEECEPYYELAPADASSVDLTNTGTCIVHYRTCVENCTPCTNCTSDTSWSLVKTGYEKKVTRKCKCDGTCTATTQYRCRTGFWGTTTNGTSGCNQCPPATNGVTTTSVAGSNETIANCYIPDGTTGSDDTGNYIYRGDCHYKN